MTQSRRSTLQLVGTVLISTIGGCLRVPRADEPPEQTTSEPNRTSHPPVTNATRGEGGVRDWAVPLNLKSSTVPFVSFTIGDPRSLPRDVNPHYVVIENREEREQQITIRIQDERATRTAINAEIQFPSQGIAQVKMATPATYDVSITASGETEQFTVAQSMFDCNDSATGVYVHSDGEITRTSVATEMACSPK